MTFTPLRFSHSDPAKALFFAELRKRVDAYFKSNGLSKFGNATMVWKTIILLSAYIAPFILILALAMPFWLQLLLWIVMGFGLAGIGMSIMHDANHGSYSSSSKKNMWLGLTLNLLGASVYNWKIQHNLLHHTYTNVAGVDDDIDDKLIMKFSPHTEVKWYHRFQFIYVFFFYGITTIYWAFLKDFLQFARYNKEKVKKDTKEQVRTALLKMIASKVFYFFVFLILPLVIVRVPVAEYIIGFCVMHFFAGVVLTVIFQLAHTVEETTHPLPDANFTIENNWAIHQLNTTVNFCRNNKFITWYVGGLNFQVEHHLFPSICHVHYPNIAPIVKATAEEFGIPYLENKTFADAIASHIAALKRFGKMPDINEAIA